MKKILTLLAIALAVLTSCKPDEEEITPSEVYLNVYYDDIVFPSDGGEDSFEIESNGDWVITNDADWLTIEPSEGKGSCSITLTASASDLYDDRNTVITVYAGDKTETFTVTQKYSEALLVTKNKFDIPQEGGELTVEVQSNISYDIVIDEDCQLWITEAPSSKALNTYTHTFSVASNQDTTKREGRIEIIGSNGKTETVNIYQAQKDELVLSKSEETVPAKGGEVRVQLRSNVDYEVTVPEDVDWVEQLQSDKADELVFNVMPNSETSTREAEITVKDKNSDLSQIFTIIQTSGSIVLDETYFEVPARGDTLDVVFTSDVEYELIIGEDDASWVTYEETNSVDSHQHNLRIFIGPNTVNEIRTAEIDIKDKNSDLSQTITIKQIVGSIILEDSYLEVDAKGGSIEVNLSTDIDFEVIIPENIDWVTRIETKSLEKRTFNLNVLPNSQTEEREAKITVKDINSDVSQPLTIKQKVGKIIVEQNQYEVWFKGETISIPYSSDIECKVIIPESAQSWISVVETKSMESHSVQLSIALNEEKNERIATITIQDINSPLSQDITITQMEYGYYKGNIKATSEAELKRIYDAGYTIIDGDVYLNVKTLSQLGNLIEEIRGDLELGEEVTTLDGLYGLTSIGGDLLFDCPNLSSLEGLNNLKTIEGDFECSGEVFILPSRTLSFQPLSNLESIRGDLNITCIKIFDGSDKLAHIGGSLIMSNVDLCKGLTGITSIENIKAIDVTINSFEDFCTNLTTISEDLYFERCDIKSFEGLSKLSNIGGNFHFVSGCDNLINFSGLNNLQTIGGDFIIEPFGDIYSASDYFNSLESFKGLESLKTISGSFIIKADTDYYGQEGHVVLDKLSSFEGLTNLNKIGGSFEIHANAPQHTSSVLCSLQSLKGLDNLQEIGGNFIINVPAISGTALTSFSCSYGPSKLSLINGDFIILSSTYTGSSYPTITSMTCFAGLERINGNLEIENISSFSGFDNLKYIGGDFILQGGDTQGLSKLSTIAGSLIVGGYSTDINGLTGLKTVNGDMFINSISMPAINGLTQLQEVGGDIEISDNSELEDISGFSGLTNCANISITNSPKLYNFQPLETAAKNMTGTWYVYGCGYNPTKYQMLNGESKPQE